MSKQQVQELNINGVPSSLNLTNIGAYINNGTTNIEIKKYIDDKVKSASGNTGGGGTVVEGGYPKLIVLGDTTRTPLEESVEAYNYFRNTPSDQWDGRYIVAIGAKETGLCYPYKIKIADSDRIRVYAIKTTDNFPTTYVEYFWNANGKLTTYATKTYLSESNYKNYISGGSTGGSGAKIIILNDDTFNTAEERKEAFEYIKTLKGDVKYDGRYTFLWKDNNNYTTITTIFAHNDDYEIGDNWVELFFDTYGTWWQVSWRPDNQYAGSYLGELVGNMSPITEAPRNAYSVHNWGLYDDGSTWAPISYDKDFYEIVNPTRFTHIGKVWEKQMPYEENHIPTREDWDNAPSDYYTIMNVGRYCFNPSYGLINELSYGRLVGYEPSNKWRIIKYEYEWCKVKLYRAFVEDGILKIQFGVVNLDDSDDYSWDGMYEIEGWKERWGFTQLEDQEITLEPYRLTMENVNSVYPKENAFYVYR